MNHLESEAEKAETDGDYSRAVSIWKALAEAHESAHYLRRYGRVAQRLSLWDVAESAFDRALELEPSPFTMELIGSLWTEREDKEGDLRAEHAREWLSRAIAIEKTSRRLLFLGVAYSDLKNELAAEKAFEEALVLDEQNEEALYNLALLKELKNPIFATELLERAIEIDPNYGAAHQLLGRISQRASDFVRAEYHFRRALEISPDDYWSMLYLANLLSVQGLTENAMKMYQTAIALRPDDEAGARFYSDFLASIEREKA